MILHLLISLFNHIMFIVPPTYNYYNRFIAFITLHLLHKVLSHYARKKIDFRLTFVAYRLETLSIENCWISIELFVLDQIKFSWFTWLRILHMRPCLQNVAYPKIFPATTSIILWCNIDFSQLCRRWLGDLNNNQWGYLKIHNCITVLKE